MCAAERLTQSALDLIRDTRQACADLSLARERGRIAGESLALRKRIADQGEARLKEGDIGEQDAATARIDALTADQDATRIRYEQTLAEERLRNLLGLGRKRVPVAIVDPPTPAAPEPDVEALVAEAIQTRPDVFAAEQLAEAAGDRLRTSKMSWFRFLFVLDATSGRKTGHEFGPAFRATLPIFNRNQGLIIRAEGEVEQAQRRVRTLRDSIAQDVRLAHARCRQARAEYDVMMTKVRPEIEASVKRGEEAFKEGNVSYLVVLEATRQLIDNYLREATIRTDLRRARADLERSVGRRLDAPPPPVVIATRKDGRP